MRLVAGGTRRAPESSLRCVHRRAACLRFRAPASLLEADRKNPQVALSVWLVWQASAMHWCDPANLSNALLPPIAVTPEAGCCKYTNQVLARPARPQQGRANPFGAPAI